MISRGRHQHNEINAAIKVVLGENNALFVKEDHNGHRWGWIMCVCGDSPFSVNSTPRNPGTHAKQIARWRVRHAECASNDQEETS
ncbi:hypothetical protein HII36_32240 [Nonomuraea sp. NN258]|uniref:hypothetical protein n=1 Tax=Nonomuraea antri TaxID=2730852 RepID=UPI001C2BF354|nr:hypothetical protein [Nonomuraea antri]NRQ36469.1 hypothetical protein [Nonomuraea antri]